MARESKSKRDGRRFGKAERLADRAMAWNWGPPPWMRLYPNDQKEAAIRNWMEESNKFKEILSNSTVVVADNVQQWCKEQAFTVDRDTDWKKDIPCWMPPFQSLFIEYKAVDYQDGFSDKFDRVGLLIETFSKDECREVYPPEWNQIEDGKRVIFAHLFASRRGSEEFLGPLVMLAVLLNEHGEILDNDPAACVAFGGVLDRREEISVGLDLKIQALPGFFALAFLNCKKVILTPVEADRETNKIRAKNGRKPFLRYHTINIEPLKAVLRTEGEIETNGLCLALHKCRGHFGTLTRNNKGEPLEKPTVYYREAHIRGSIKSGVVISDYKVDPPKTPRITS